MQRRRGADRTYYYIIIKLVVFCSSTLCIYNVLPPPFYLSLPAVQYTVCHRGLPLPTVLARVCYNVNCYTQDGLTVGGCTQHSDMTCPSISTRIDAFPKHGPTVFVPRTPSTTGLCYLHRRQACEISSLWPMGCVGGKKRSTFLRSRSQKRAMGKTPTICARNV